MILVAWVLAVVAVAFVLAELLGRVWLWYRRWYAIFPPGLRAHVHPDPEVFPQLAPMARFYVNRDGERGDEPPSSADGLYRILVGGGSMAEGFFLDQDVTWPGVVQRLLESPERLRMLGARKVHVGCIARSGVGSEALDLVFSRVLPNYPRLQMIVTLVGVSDVMRWIEQRTPRMLEPVCTDDVFRCHPEGPFGWRPRQLALTELVRRAWRRWFRPVEVYDRAGRWIGRARAMRANATHIRTSIADPAPMLDHFEDHFRHLLETAKAHADRVLVIRQPWLDKAFTPEEAASMWHGGVGQAWREELSTYYALETFAGVMAALDARAAAVARELGVEQLDLMPLLEPSLKTYYDAFHLTDAGARQVADAVTSAILQQPPRAHHMAQPGAPVAAQDRAALRAS